VIVVAFGDVVFEDVFVLDAMLDGFFFGRLGKAIVELVPVVLATSRAWAVALSEL
jgi:hypothetical protein